MNKQISKKKVLPWNWVKVAGEDQVRLVREDRVIPEGPSGSTYTFCNILVLAIKKAKELKGSIEQEVGFSDPFSAKSLQLSKVSDILGYYMIKLANLGYKMSRNLEEYKHKGIDDFINIYRLDKREPRAFKRKSLEGIFRDFITLQDLMATQGDFYVNSDRVQVKVLDELKDIYNEMQKGFILLHTIKPDAIQSNR